MVLLWFVLWLGSRDFFRLPIAESVAVVTSFGAVHPFDVALVSFGVALIGRIPRINAEWEVEGLQTLFVAPACGVSVFHTFNLSEKSVLSSDFFHADFPVGKEQMHIASSHLHAILTPDGALIALRNVVTEVFHGVEDDFLFVGSFCYHAYTIPQNAQKARIFFAIVQFFLLFFCLTFVNC